MGKEKKKELFAVSSNDDGERALVSLWSLDKNGNGISDSYETWEYRAYKETVV